MTSAPDLDAIYRRLWRAWPGGLGVFQLVSDASDPNGYSQAKNAVSRLLALGRIECAPYGGYRARMT